MVKDVSIFYLLFLLSIAQTVSSGQSARNGKPEAGAYTLTVPVDEVSLMFHVADFEGLPVEDMTMDDLRLFDDGKRVKQVLSFQSYSNLPIRAGILFDTSRSMAGLRLNQEIAGLYVAHLLRKETDQAFVMRFDSESKVKQAWTNDTGLLTESLRAIGMDRNSRLGGTVLFDSLFKACRDQWRSDLSITGNFILLFTDGEDNASHARLGDVVDRCQQSRVSIYVFSDEPKVFLSPGEKTLQELVKKSGGQIFFGSTAAELWNDLRIMESDERSQYRIVYKPPHLKLDGSFRRIKLGSPVRGCVITARSGYYASP